jgi:hypothetical protein
VYAKQQQQQQQQITCADHVPGLHTVHGRQHTTAATADKPHTNSRHRARPSKTLRTVQHNGPKPWQSGSLRPGSQAVLNPDSQVRRHVTGPQRMLPKARHINDTCVTVRASADNPNLGSRVVGGQVHMLTQADDQCTAASAHTRSQQQRSGLSGTLRAHTPIQQALRGPQLFLSPMHPPPHPNKPRVHRTELKTPKPPQAPGLQTACVHNLDNHGSQSFSAGSSLRTSLNLGGQGTPPASPSNPGTALSPCHASSPAESGLGSRFSWGLADA